MTASPNFGLLCQFIGIGVIEVQGIFYTQGAEGEASLESIELRADNSRSVLFAAASDWTMEILPGTWPELPSACWPPEEWAFALLDTPVGGPGFEKILSLTAQFNEVGEFVGVHLDFRRGKFAMASAESISFTVVEATA